MRRSKLSCCINLPYCYGQQRSGRLRHSHFQTRHLNTQICIAVIEEMWQLRASFFPVHPNVVQVRLSAKYALAIVLSYSSVRPEDPRFVFVLDCFKRLLLVTNGSTRSSRSSVSKENQKYSDRSHSCTARETWSAADLS